MLAGLEPIFVESFSFLLPKTLPNTALFTELVAFSLFCQCRIGTHYGSVASASAEFKNYISQNNTDAVVYNIFATIPMSVLHEFFDGLPIARGLSVRLNLFLNTGITITQSVTASNHGAITSSVIPRQTCPFMVSPIANNPLVGSGLDMGFPLKRL